MAITLKDLHSVRATLPPRVLIFGPPGIGKAQPLAAKILTPMGWKTMGEMKIGMPICGSNGKTYRISGVYPQGILPAYRITFTDHTSVECGAEHLWKVRGHHFSRDGWLIRTTEQLMAGNSRERDHRKFSIPLAEAFEFIQEALPVPPYLMGVLIGDGYLKGDCAAFSVPPAKERIKQKVLATSDVQLSGPYGSLSSPQWHIIGGKKNETTMSAIMKKLKLNVGSKERFIPEPYKWASINDRLELLRGLMDTDGSANSGNRVTYCTCSGKLATDVADLVRSLGGIAIIRKYDRSHQNKPTEWHVNVKLKICPFSLDYKAACWRPAAFTYGKHIKSIEYIGDVQQQCIKVTAPDSLYVTDGYNLTHNTSLASEFPFPVFLQIEDGTPSDLELQSFGHLTSYNQVMESISALYLEEHSGATVVLDSLDKLEPLLWAKVCADNQWASIETPGYGKGYVMADQEWRDMLEGLNALRRDKHMGVVLIAHSNIETINDPMTASYSRYDIRLHKRAIGIIQDEMDAVLFLNQDVSLLQNDPRAKSGPGTRLRAAGGGHRFIHATPRPAYVAKNRFGLPDKIQYEKGQGYEAMKPYFPGAIEMRKKPNGNKVKAA